MPAGARLVLACALRHHPPAFPACRPLRRRSAVCCWERFEGGVASSPADVLLCSSPCLPLRVIGEVHASEHQVVALRSISQLFSCSDSPVKSRSDCFFFPMPSCIALISLISCPTTPRDLPLLARESILGFGGGRSAQGRLQESSPMQDQ